MAGGIVYVIGDGRLPTKVGYSFSVRSRLQQLRSKTRRDLTVIYGRPVSRDMARAVEQWAHYMLRANRIGREEWFMVSPEVALKAIDEALLRYSRGEMIPSATGNERLSIYLSPADLVRVSRWRARQPDIPNLSEALRRLAEIGLLSHRPSALPASAPPEVAP